MNNVPDCVLLFLNILLMLVIVLLNVFPLNGARGEIEEDVFLLSIFVFFHNVVLFF